MSDRNARQLLGAAKRRSLALPERGVELALLDWGGGGPLALLHHANGFCKGTLALVAAGLRDRFRVIAMDARGHGDSSRPAGGGAYAWSQFAADVGAVAERLAEEAGAPVALGLGHSFGGTSMIGAASSRPDLFRALVLVDPVMPPPPGSTTPAERQAHVARLVEGATRRRADWPSRDEAREWFSTRSLFERWTPAALDLYVEDGLRERPDGSVELKCPGAVEAAVFAGGGDVDVPALARGGAVPTLYLHASRGDFPIARYRELAASMRRARVQDVDSGHLVPMERPDLVIDAARGFADEVAAL